MPLARLHAPFNHPEPKLDGFRAVAYIENGGAKEKPRMPNHESTRSILEAAIVGFEAQKKQIDVQIAELRAMLSTGLGPHAVATEVSPDATPGKRRPMSAAARKRIGDAQRKRWAASKGESAPAAVAPAKAKRKLSKAGRAAIIAATKARWARVRAEAEKKKSAAKKKTSPKRRVVKPAPARAAKKAAPAKQAKAPAKKTAPATA